MKYRLILLVLLLWGNVYAADKVILRGRVLMAAADSIEVSFNDNMLAYYPQKFSTKLDKEGRFSLMFAVPDKGYTIVQLQYGNSMADLLVRPGDSLVLNVNATRFDSTIHYEGRGANVQNFLAAYVLKKGRINQYSTRVRAWIQKEPDDFISALDNALSEETAIADKWQPALPAAFTQYWSAFHRYYNYFFIEQYPQMHEMLKLRRYTDTVPDINYKVVKHLPLTFYDSLLTVPPYILYLTGVLETKLKAEGYAWNGKDAAAKQRFDDSVFALAYTTMPDKSLENYIAQNIYGRAKDQELQRTEEQLQTFKNKWPYSEYMTLLDKQVAIARKIAPGQPAPDMDIVAADGTPMHLSDLKGKVVYLGFWSGNCKQCVGEMVKERMVKDLIIKKPLAFVYVSLGTDTVTEHAIRERYRIDGYTATAKGGWNSKEVADYGVQSLPAYYLIDEDGKFAMQRPPSPPQTTELVMAIEKLFK